MSNNLEENKSLSPGPRTAPDGSSLLNFSLDCIHEVIFLIDEQDHFFNINAQACAFLGYERSELLALCVVDIDADDPALPWPAACSELKEKGGITFERCLKTKAGNLIPVEVHANYCQMDGANYNLALVYDLSTKKQMQQTLLENENCYHSLIETAYEGIIIHEDGIILDSNLQFAHILGYQSPAELLGKNAFELILAPSPQEGVKVRFSSAAMRSVEVLCKRKDGSTFVGETQSRAMSRMGKNVQVLALRDISDLIQVEATVKDQSLRAQVLGELSQALIDTSHDFAKTAELAVKSCAQLIGDGASLFWYTPENPNLELIAVYNPDPALIAFFRHHIINYPIRADEGAYGRVIQSIQPVIIPIVDMDGVIASATQERKEYYQKLPVYSMILAPLRLKGKCIGVIGLGRHAPTHAHYTWSDLLFLQEIADQISIGLVNAQLYNDLQKELSERIRAENEVRLLNAGLEQRVADRTAQLEAANKELETFSYSVSHDLRAPLRAIHSFSTILQEDYHTRLDTSGMEYLNRIVNAAAAMYEKIEALLKLSRIIRVEIHPQQVDLSSMVEAEIDLLRAAEPGRKATIMVAPGLVAWADRALLQVVIDNLFNNAWKYTSKKAETFIEFGVTDIKNKKTYFIKDNGAGFDMAFVGKLFGTFERLHNLSEFPGHGIGLATVQRVVQRHGGEIWAEADVGQGATFYFTLG